MNKFANLLALAALVVAPSLWAQNAGQFKATLPSGSTVTVTALSDKVIKVTQLAPGETEHVSRAAVLSEPLSQCIVSTDGPITSLTTPAGVIAAVDTRSGEVKISSGAGRTITDKGIRTLADGKRELEIVTQGVGSFYGAGERGHKLNLAGDSLVMYNRQNYGYTGDDPRISQMNITMPLFLSSNGYAVVFDDYAAATMIMGNPIKYISESPDPISFYYVDGGGTLKGVTQELSALTGRQDLPPFWALGYITSKYGYKTEAETRGVIDTLKTAGYPVDGIVLDLYWYGQETDMGRLAWDPEQWPTHKQMLADLKAKHVNLIPISQPYVLRNGRGIDNFNMGMERGLFVKDSTEPDSLGGVQNVTIWVGEGGMWDVSNPDTRAWLANRYKELTDEGVTGWWGDLGEPEVHPLTGIHHNGLTTRQYHNQYGNDWSEIIYDLYKEQYPNTRLMTMMRGGTTGLQRYSVYPWSTDVSRSWGGLEPQVVIMLNSGLSGLGYMGHDVGGFAIDPEKPYDPELYVRWLQLGLFSPILRTHAQATAEPYKYPDQQHIILPIIKERYRWLPYNYTLAYENASEGSPLVRPLNYYDEANTAHDAIRDEFLWGKDVLVAPVMKQGAVERQVTFPTGTWVDYSNPTIIYKGGDTITYPAPLDVIPLFVRAGAIIPSADYDMGSTADYRTDTYTLNIYPVAGNSGDYTLYEDDMTSATALSQGKYALVNVKDSMDAKTLNISLSTAVGSPMVPADKTITFKVNNIVKKPRKVTVDGKKLSAKCYTYDAAKSLLTISGSWTPSTARTISVTL